MPEFIVDIFDVLAYGLPLPLGVLVSLSRYCLPCFPLSFRSTLLYMRKERNL
jgi:hypothetical protein